MVVLRPGETAAASTVALGARCVAGSPPARLDGQDGGRGQELDALDDRLGADHEAVPQVRGYGGGVESARSRPAREQARTSEANSTIFLAGVPVARPWSSTSA